MKSPEKKIKNKDATKQIHALENIEEGIEGKNISKCYSLGNLESLKHQITFQSQKIVFFVLALSQHILTYIIFFALYVDETDLVSACFLGCY